MKIRTQYRTTLTVLAALLLIVLASMLFINREAARATARQMRAESVAVGASELGYLAAEYVIYGEEVQLDRWRARFASFSREVSSLEVVTTEDKALARNIRANQEHMDEVFQSVIAAAAHAKKDGGGVRTELLQVSWSRMSIQSQALVADASRLARNQRTRTEKLSWAAPLVAFAMLGCFGLFFLLTYISLQRRTLRSIGTLQSGASVIGSGNLAFRVPVERDDEIGDLAQAFNTWRGASTSAPRTCARQTRCCAW